MLGAAKKVGLGAIDTTILDTVVVTVGVNGQHQGWSDGSVYPSIGSRLPTTLGGNTIKAITNYNFGFAIHITGDHTGGALFGDAWIEDYGRVTSWGSIGYVGGGNYTQWYANILNSSEWADSGNPRTVIFYKP